MKDNQHKLLMRNIWSALLLILVIGFPFFTSSSSQPVHAEDVQTEDCLVGKTCIFVPFVSLSIPQGDLKLENVEVTQAIQDANNSVPMVAGRTTVLRIFATTGAAAKALNNVQVEVTATRGGNLLSGSPTSFKTSVPLSYSRSDFSTSLNMMLPESWLSETIDLTVWLDPENQIDETNETNNNLTLRLTFLQVPALDVKIVPIRYTHTPNGITYNPPSQDTLSSYLTRIYPVSQVNISWHTAVDYTGDLSKSADWFELLEEISSIKDAEHAPSSTVYYGWIPTSNNNLNNWFFGGYAGLGWVGGRTSVGLNTSSSAAQIAAHEIGHNMGMWHSPCNVSSGTDPEFPYSDGSIGQYGLDVVDGTVYTPDLYRDLMSYCSPKWISDYTYEHIMQDQIVNGAQTTPLLSAQAPQNPAQGSMMVRAHISENEASLLPVYVLNAQLNQAPEAGEYILQLFGEDGKLVSAAPVRGKTMALDGAERVGIHTVVPLPEQAIAKVRLVKDGVVLAEQALHEAAISATQVQTDVAADGTTVLRWNDTSPALVRYTTDNGQTWTTLGVDVEGGMLKIDPQSLPAQGGTFEVILANTIN